MEMLSAIGSAVRLSLTMFWQILGGLSLGFTFSAIVEVAVSKETISALLPDRRPRSIVIAGLLGAPTSSCSYAAVATARSIVRRGMDLSAVSQTQLNDIAKRLNGRPRMTLGWKTPEEALAIEMADYAKRVALDS